MTVLAVVCAIVVATGKPVCSDPVDMIRASVVVALCNKEHPFNKGDIVGAFTLFLEGDKPADAGHLEIGHLKQE